MNNYVVEVGNLSHLYPDGTAALRGITFTITPGESVAIIGANGAGKSTLLLHLNGVLAPTEGEVRINGVSLTKETLPVIRRSVGMVFQEPDDQLFMATLYDDVAFGPLNQGLTGAELESRVTDALNKVGIDHLREKAPYNLSGGEKKTGGYCVSIVHVAGYSCDGRADERVRPLCPAATHGIAARV